MDKILLTVTQVVSDTEDAILIYFEDSQIPRFLPGQFLTLLVPVEGITLRRSYSICTDPEQWPRVGICVKRLPGGKVSNHLADHLRAGQTLEVLPPYGSFRWDPQQEHPDSLVLIGAGSGITPLMSVLQAALHHPEQPSVTLIYGSRDPEHTLFRASLDALVLTGQGRLKVVHCWSKTAPPMASVANQNAVPNNETPKATPTSSYFGRIDAEALRRFCCDSQGQADPNAQYYLCGPEGLVHDSQQWLLHQGIAGQRLHKELFFQSPSTAPSGQETPASPPPAPFDPVEEEQALPVVTLKVDGKVYEFAVENGRFILETALEQGIDLPYACTMGVCGMCRAKKISGDMHLGDQEALSTSEIASGACLTCVGKPLSKRLVIDYDVPN
jgi:ring-1,2-phenylacetyl-CoA epoxidase subunit PaaE